jgi:positive regulator of sigma E activity
MTEQGIVTATNNRTAKVKIDKKDECSKCGMCLFPKNASSIEVVADNVLGATEGDTVIVETTGETKLLATALVFVVPLLLIGLAVLINYLLIKSEIWILILSVIFIVLWYTILAVIDKRFVKLKKLSAKITEIIKEKIENE